MASNSVISLMAFFFALIMNSLLESSSQLAIAGMAIAFGAAALIISTYVEFSVITYDKLFKIIIVSTIGVCVAGLIDITFNAPPPLTTTLVAGIVSSLMYGVLSGDAKWTWDAISQSELLCQYVASFFRHTNMDLPLNVPIEMKMVYLAMVLPNDVMRWVHVKTIMVQLENEYQVEMNYLIVNSDSVFENVTAWKHLPRGFFQIKDPKTGEIIIRCGNSKFVYMTDLKCMSHAIPSHTANLDVEGVDKLNGEKINISAVLINGLWYWLITSKQVCILCPFGKISCYVHSERYVDECFGTVKKIALIFECHLAKIGNEKAAELFGTLLKTEFTLNGEAILSDQGHLVKELDEHIDTIRGFSFTKNKSSMSEGHIAMPLSKTFELLSYFGFKTPNISKTFKFNSPEFKKYLQNLRFAENQEGNVLYFTCPVTKMVLFMIKTKCMIYDVMRDIIRHGILMGWPLNKILNEIKSSNSELACTTPEDKSFVEDWKKKNSDLIKKFYNLLVEENIIKSCVAMNGKDKESSDKRFEFRNKFIFFWNKAKTELELEPHSTEVKNIIYTSANFTNDGSKMLKALMIEAGVVFKKSSKMMNKHHVTLFHIKSDRPCNRSELIEGKVVKCQITKVLVGPNGNIVAMCKIDGVSPQNLYPHVTVALQPNENPKVSIDIIALWNKEDGGIMSYDVKDNEFSLTVEHHRD